MLSVKHTHINRPKGHSNKGTTMELQITIQDVVVLFTNIHRDGCYSHFGDNHGEGVWTRTSGTCEQFGFREMRCYYEQKLLSYVLPDDIKKKLSDMSRFTGWANTIYVRELPKPKDDEGTSMRVDLYTRKEVKGSFGLSHIPRRYKERKVAEVDLQDGDEVSLHGWFVGDWAVYCSVVIRRGGEKLAEGLWGGHINGRDRFVPYDIKPDVELETSSTYVFGHYFGKPFLRRK